MLTTSRLLEVLSSRDPPPGEGKRIPKYLYTVRKQLLDKKLSQILNILQTNHWEELTKYLSDLPRNSTPITLMARLRKADIFIENERKLDVLYTYLIDVYVINHYLRLIEANVENSIDYENVTYD